MIKLEASENTSAYDVVVVGYGPVGQALTAMLGAKGHRVAVVERWPDLFPLPRAGHIDHEIMRILQSLGVADTVAEDSWEWNGLDFIAADGEVLRSLGWGYEAGSAWHSDYSIFQPYLESLLHDRVTACPTVELFRGWQAEELETVGTGARVRIRRAATTDGEWTPGPEVRTLTASYLVGCDGANSIVRRASGTTVTDFGFEADWLVVFVQPDDPSVVVDMPDVAQILDPARPTSAFRSSGKRFCRWEFMLMPGETAESMSGPDVAWKLVERWGVNPGNARLVRNTVFRFRSIVADHWRCGPMFIAGDAAHLMPPFLGQGLCSGLRDAANLAWKLDLVLRGAAPDRLLDTYEQERKEHAAAVVRASLAVGEIIMVTEPAAAAERDRRLRSGELGTPGPLPRLRQGVLLPGPHAGELSVQPRIRVNGRSGRCDDLIGTGWRILTTGWDAAAAMAPRSRAICRLLDAEVVRIAEPGHVTPGVAEDVDGRFTEWAGRRVGPTGAVIIRPDFYVFGTAEGPAALDAALERLADRLGLTLPTGEPRQEQGMPT